VDEGREPPSLGIEFKVDKDGFIVAPEGEDFGLPTESEAENSRLRDVELPSGNSTRLEVPSLACLLWAGDSKQQLAKAIWRHPEGNIEIFKDLADYEVDYIYEWGITEFAKRKESLNLASICKLFHVMPSAYVGIKDKMASFLFDTIIAGTLGEEEARQYKAMEKQGKNRGVVGNLPPDPQEVSQ
jgi:hypothetical protein